MVEINEKFRNREAETQSSELSSYRRISLLKWLKQGSQFLRLNSNSCVDNFKMKTSRLVVRCADRDLSALRREFHCVVDQIPEHLLKPNAISENVMPFCFKPTRYVQLFCRYGRGSGKTIERIE